MNELTETQLDSLADLHVSDQQAFHGRSFDESVTDWLNRSPSCVLGLCFMLDAELVGLTLFNRAPAHADGGHSETASVHGLKVATPWQGQGWGHVAFKMAVQTLIKEWDKTKNLVLTVDADNAAALAVYRGYGMQETGPIVEGKHGPEHHLSVQLF
jgi:ribosomal protein S18 acetylase RimI-like enzyme